MMDTAAMLAWFKTLSESEKILFLLDMMYEFTIVIRSVFHDGDKERSLAAAYSLSEFNHRLTSKVSAMLENKATYPDDMVVGGFVHRFSQPELRAEAFIWDRLVQRANNRRSASQRP
jgi:hypothetical protein